MVSTVADSPWLMVSKVDVAEAFGPMRTQEWLALSLPVSLVLLFAGFVAGHWQWRAWRRERALKTELEHNMRWLENGQKAAAIGYFAYDVSSQEFLMSGMASQIYGLPPERRTNHPTWPAAPSPRRQGWLRPSHRCACPESARRPAAHTHGIFPTAFLSSGTAGARQALGRMTSRPLPGQIPPGSSAGRIRYSRSTDAPGTADADGAAGLKAHHTDHRRTASQLLDVERCPAASPAADLPPA